MGWRFAVSEAMGSQPCITMTPDLCEVVKYTDECICARICLKKPPTRRSCIFNQEDCQLTSAPLGWLPFLPQKEGLSIRTPAPLSAPPTIHVIFDSCPFCLSHTQTLSGQNSVLCPFVSGPGKVNYPIASPAHSPAEARDCLIPAAARPATKDFQQEVLWGASVPGSLSFKPPVPSPSCLMGQAGVTCLL